MSDIGGFSLSMFIIIWIAFSIIVGAIADQRGRDAIVFFFTALILSPLIAIIILIAIPAVTPPDPQKTQCPHCHGLVDRHVECCMHCRRDIQWHAEPALLSASIKSEISDISDLAECQYCGRMFSFNSNGQDDVACTHCTMMNTVRTEQVKDLCFTECPECGKNISLQLNNRLVETLCPFCQAILKLDPAVA